jgi:hypothetical protein
MIRYFRFNNDKVLLVRTILPLLISFLPLSCPKTIFLSWLINLAVSSSSVNLMIFVFLETFEV